MSTRYKVRKAPVHHCGKEVYCVVDTEAAKLKKEDYPYMSNTEFKELEMRCQELAEAFRKKDALIIVSALNKLALKNKRV